MRELDKALMALRLEVDGSIVDNIKEIAERHIPEAYTDLQETLADTREELQASKSLLNIKSEMLNSAEAEVEELETFLERSRTAHAKCIAERDRLRERLTEATGLLEANERENERLRERVKQLTHPIQAIRAALDGEGEK
jgi:chromosome segregation ATPase